jgi:hypothetical protein
MSKSDMAQIRALCRSDELHALKTASIARTIADANAAAKAGTLKQLTPPPGQPRHLRVRTGKEQPDFEPLTDAQYAVLEKAAPKARGKVISSIIDTLLNAPRGETLQLDRASLTASAATATELQMQLAYDFAVLLLSERGQKAVVQYLYDEIGQCTVANLLGAKKMTVPAERTRALVYTHAFLRDLLDPAKTQRVPKDVRATAKWLLRHYPEPSTVGHAHNLCPQLFGPLPDQMPPLTYAQRAKLGVEK